jgi:hypothetical protein
VPTVVFLGVGDPVATHLIERPSYSAGRRGQVASRQFLGPTGHCFT